jgi:hypothetical protein
LLESRHHLIASALASIMSIGSGTQTTPLGTPGTATVSLKGADVSVSGEYPHRALRQRVHHARGDGISGGIELHNVVGEETAVLEATLHVTV